MATMIETTPNVELQRLLRDRRTLAIGLVWGGLVLLIFGFWFAANDRDALKIVSYLAFAVALCLAVTLFAVRGGAGEPEQRLTKLRPQQRAVGLILQAVGAVLFLIGVWLVFSERLQGIAEGGGLALVGLIAAVTGYRMVVKPKVPLHDRIITVLGNNQKPVGLGLFIVGALCMLLGLYLRIKTKPNPAVNEPVAQAVKEDGDKTQPATIPDPAGFPQWAGLLFLGMIGVGSGLRLYLAKESNIRIMVLIVGGCTGLVIALMTLAQMWIWRETLTGGLPAWRGENGWRIWLCVYLELFGLGLMFGSFMLAKTDIRVNPVLRRVLYGYNAIFTGLLLIAFLAILNVFVYAIYPMTYDWSADRGVYNISDSTKGILEKLNEPTTIYVLVSPRAPRLYKDVKTLLDNCRTVSDKLSVEYISPDKDLYKYETLARRYPEILPEAKVARETEIIGRGLLIVYGRDSDNPKDKPPPNAFIASNKLFEERGGFRGAPRTYIFQGEKVLRSELKFLTQGRKKIKVYLLQGNEELETRGSRRATRGSNFDLPMSVLGVAFLIDRLRNENYEVQGLTFGIGKDDVDMKYISPKDKKADIPEDADIVVLPGPSAPIPKTTLDALERYLQRDTGRLIVMLDVVVDRKYTEMVTTGIEELLKKHNVLVGKDYVFRVPFEGGGSPDPFFVVATTPRDSGNKLAGKYVDSAFPLKSVRVVRPGTESPSFRAETILEVTRLRRPVLQEIFWAEDSLRALDDSRTFILELLKKGEEELVAKVSRDPIPVGVAVKDKEDRPRMVVFGDAEMASDGVMAGPLRDVYFDLFVSTLNYLAARPDVGALPKPPKLFTLGPMVPTTPLTFLPAWLMCLGIFGLGLGMWVVRRR